MTNPKRKKTNGDPPPRELTGVPELLASPAKKETRPCSEPRGRNEAAASAIEGGRLTCRRRPPVGGAIELELLLGLRLRLPHGHVLGTGHRGGGGFGGCGRGRRGRATGEEWQRFEFCPRHPALSADGRVECNGHLGAFGAWGYGQFFSILIFNYYFRNKPGEMFF
jgi:hypothetical protein